MSAVEYIFSADMKPRSDEEVAYACHDDSKKNAALGELFDRFSLRVRRYLIRLVGKEDAEDLTQQTFMEVAQERALYDGRATVQAWLFGIATNMARRHRRGFGKRVRLALALTQTPQTLAPSPEGQVRVNGEMQRARVAISKLSEKQRESFVLCVLERMSAQDVAKLLGCSEAAVWKRVSKARAKIRAFVEAE